MREEKAVAAVRLDSLLARWPRPDLLKIDVEGAEALCLRGAERLLHEQRPIVLCEVAMENAEEVGRLLGRHRYRIFDASRPARERRPLERPAWNTLAWPG